jgi:Cu(I)/Ag(I) efflux system membrane fusion protein
METQGLSRFGLTGPRGVILLALLFVFAFALGRIGSGGREAAQVARDSAQEAAADVWTCSMHPQIQLPAPGDCPICGMDLIALVPDDGGELDPRQLRMSESAIALAGIQTTPALRAFASTEVRMYGKLDYDESRVAYITAWAPGRLDRLYVSYAGVTVNKGDHLVDMYSPVLFAAQEELVQASTAVTALEKSESVALRSTSVATLDAAREKLRLYGLTPEQIQRVETTGQTTDNLTIYAPAGGIVVHQNAREGMYVTTGERIYTIADLSKLWVLFEAYESDLPWLHFGQRVAFTTRSFPGERFEGVVSFIDPLVDPKTRTVRVRAVVDNAKGRLKPDMFVNGIVESRIDAHGHIIDVHLAGKWICPMHPEVVKNGPSDCDECGMDLVPASELGFVPASDAESEAPILIPASAPLITGKRAIVYVQVEQAGARVFEGREVVLGPRAGNFYVVRDGVGEGELVVTNGAFKIDSELQIQARPSMMSPAGGALPAHNHGGTVQHAAMSGAPDAKSPATPSSASGEARAAIAPLYTTYFGVQMALAKDDLPGAKAAADTLAQATAGVDMALFKGEAHMRWMELSRIITARAKSVAGAKDLEAARDAFFHLSGAVIEVERAFGHSGEEKHYLTHCPMARGGDGAYWLQPVDTVWNSFYGDRMLRCGSVEEAFPPAEGDRTHDTH